MGEVRPIGIEAGKPFDVSKLSEAQKAALVEGAKSGVEKIEKKGRTLGAEVDGWRTGLNGGSRASFGGDWLRRAAVALAEIYANDRAEALYPTTRTDATGAVLDGAKSGYSITLIHPLIFRPIRRSR